LSDFRITRARLKSRENPRERFVGWKSTINETSYDEERNRKRPTRRRTLRQIAHCGAVNSFAEHFCCRIDFIVVRPAITCFLQGALRVLHTIFLISDRFRDRLRIDPFRRELERPLSKRLRGKIMRASVSDCGEHLRSNVCW
jgi:hypothetical protein